MTVYVDPLFDTTDSLERHNATGKSWTWPEACHMYADTLEELHRMARTLRLKASWFQNKPHFPHYDLTPSKREEAIRNGAVEVKTLHVVEYVKRSRNAHQQPA